ncbi:twin transmembrane helix small protein [Indioceanicola profundi]|uniref:twin transmembrane helix small protein n=1 Tax=Indioceanicola profundi TaxID=2220096 RepID=UPI000E6AD483|nr:twin transmembrane helix small protein [Indioceanicola profundi]
MNGFLFTLLILTMLAVLGVLGMGLVAMARGGEFNAKYGNRLMWWRVRLQIAAIVLFVLTIFTATGS